MSKRLSLLKEPFVTIFKSWLFQNSLLLLHSLSKACKLWREAMISQSESYHVWGLSQESLKLLKQQRSERIEKVTLLSQDHLKSFTTMVVDLYGINSKFDAISNYYTFSGTTLEEKNGDLKIMPSVVGKDKHVFKCIVIILP
jgi:hypothetical protein